MPNPADPTADACVIRNLLEQREAETPDRPFALMDSGETLTYAELARRVRITANALHDGGVRQGDFVACWMPNGFELLTCWFAINSLGATYVPLNTAYRGDILGHAIALSDARLMIAHATLVPRLAECTRGVLETVIVTQGAADPIPGLDLLPGEILTQGADAPIPLDRPILPDDIHAVIFTSGTTGPSKGVLTSYVHIAMMALAHPIPGDHRELVTLPLFHAGGTSVVVRALALGGSIVLMSAFQTSSFWPIVARTQATTAILLGAMASFLNRTPELASEGHSLKAVLVLPHDTSAQEFGRTFAVDAYTAYNMSETAVPIRSAANPPEPGICGRLREGVAARLVDAEGQDVPDGEPGELILRPEIRGHFFQGYHKNRQATDAAWIDGWFHTGDRLSRDAQGNYRFVDRVKDAIRRRGENVSSYEVESVLLSHPDIREAAVVAAASEHSEDEVLAAISLKEETVIDPAALIDFLRPRMAHYMIPRYIRVLDELPKTPTMKIEKHKLRAAGVTADTWDREAAGIDVKRERL